MHYLLGTFLKAGIYTISCYRTENQTLTCLSFPTVRST